jgi:hypothetical protein
MPRLVAVLALVALTAAPLDGQSITRPRRDWRTLETEHFVIHYTLDLETWTLDMAERLESVRDAVTSLVGYAPKRKVTVLVDDPLNTPNGFALAFIDSPVIYLFPTPPAPTWSIGSYRDWGELLAVHEYGHVAHLTRPSRNPLERRLLSLLPFRIGPIARRAPTWAVEGYATLIEGRLTGSGRPYGVWRPAILRQWALEGRLPSYGQLGPSRDYRGGELPYLVGSAFLEWLVARQPAAGDSSLAHLWRRLTARQSRSFSHAFAGVFGAPPDELYGRFVAEVTAQAVAVEQATGQPDGEGGELVQRYTGETGAPAISPNAEHIALVRDYRDRPSRLIVMETRDDTTLARRVREARERLLRKDPEDVPDEPWQPLPKRVVATLHPVGGRPHAEPRFLPDGERLLVVRYEPMADGGRRRDLFIWNFRQGTLRRVTHGAGIMRADPAPDGRTAVAERCRGGRCDLVIVDLETGSLSVLATGSTRVSYYRPRFSPDGRLVVASEHRGRRWRVVLIPTSGSAVLPYDPPDRASRYDATFLDNNVLVLVSERDGAPNLVRVPLGAGVESEVRLTNVTGAALAPEPGRDGNVYYLRLHSRGLDLSRVRSDAALMATEWPSLPGSPAIARSAARADTFARSTLPPSREYGLGARGFRLVPGTQSAVNGQGLLLSLGNFDPVGRFTLLAQGAAGTAPAWRGGSLRATYRRRALEWRAELFGAGDRPSRQDVDFAPTGLDADYWGGVLVAELPRRLGDRVTELRLGASASRVVPPRGESVSRSLSFAELRHSRLQTHGELWTTQAIALHGSLGRTASDDWHRLRGSASMGIGLLDKGIRGEVEYARTGRDAPGLERIILGGAGPLLFDHALLSQRIGMPALPLGIAGGREALTYRASASAGLIELYFWGGSADPGFDAWHRVVGIETREMAAPIPFARLPELRFVTGVGYTLDSPFRHRTRGYGMLVLRP